MATLIKTQRFCINLLVLCTSTLLIYITIHHIYYYIKSPSPSDDGAPTLLILYWHGTMGSAVRPRGNVFSIISHVLYL